MPMTRPPYSSGFREQMVELVRSGRSPEELAREFEPSAQSIRNWVGQADRDEGRSHDGFAEREELRRLRRENRRLRQEREILAKAAAWFARETGDPVRVFEFVRANRANPSMCRLLGVSASGYYRVARPGAVGPRRERRSNALATSTAPRAGPTAPPAMPNSSLATLWAASGSPDGCGRCA